MNHPNVFIDNPFTELIVDNFAGGGGTSTGIYMALGREVDIAINHDPEALLMHAVNHPNTRHICEDVFDVDPREACRGRKVGLATFSPDCTHFSKARGSKPVEKLIRGLSWVLIKWAALVRPRVMIMENVEEIQQWGPIKNGQPDPKHKGRTWKSFISCLTTGLPKNHPDMAEVRKAIGPDIPIEMLVKGLGYTAEWRELRACHYGSPTIRKRLKLICRSDGRPIIWPEATHGSPDDPMVIAGLKKLWRTAGDIIDWSIPCPSIFERARALAENSLKRIAKGLWKFVFNCAKPFIVKVNHGKDEFRGQSVDEPVSTMTGKNGLGLVAPIIQHIQHGSASTGCMPADEPLRTVTSLPKGGSMAVTAATMIEVGYGEREGQAPRAKDLNQPMGTAVSSSVKAAAVQFTAYMIKHFGDKGQRPGADMAEPVPTVTAVDHNGIVTSHIVKMHERTPGQSMDEPAHTITGGGLHLGEVRAFLVKFYRDVGQDASCWDPLHTLSTKARMGIVTVEGQDYQIVDIGMRMLTPRELYRAQGFPESYIIAPMIVDKVQSRKQKKQVLKVMPDYMQVRMVGNSVCPQVMEALVRANLPELISWRGGERELVA